MMPPNVYPEGVPFFDARPPNDLPDRLVDDTTLYSVHGGMGATNGQLVAPTGQTPGPGALSPQPVYENPTPLGTSWGGSTPTAGQVLGLPPALPWQSAPTSPAQVLADDVTFITGPVYAPTVPGEG